MERIDDNGRIELQSTPRIDVEQLFYQQSLLDAARGSKLKQDFINRRCSLNHYVEHEDKAFFSDEVNIKSRA